MDATHSLPSPCLLRSQSSDGFQVKEMPLQESFNVNYGTHIVTSATMGGRDVVYIRKLQSSPLKAANIENYVKDVGEQRFLDSKSHSSCPMKYKDKDVTIIFRRRGGEDPEQSHEKWSETVPACAEFDQYDSYSNGFSTSRGAWSKEFGLCS